MFLQGKRSLLWLLILLMAFVAAGCTLGVIAPSVVPLAATGQTRTYYIAADEVEWNYAPTGINQITGKPFDDMANVFVENGPQRIGSTYRKALYREYTDATFQTLKPRPANQAYLGLLGPVIHAEVGDTIKVIFKNNATQPYSMHPHGVLYQKDAEGSPYNDGTDHQGDIVQPSEVYTYTWAVPERAGPGSSDPSSIVWAYHSHVGETSDVYAGLVGPIVITKKGMANPDGTPKDVDQEIISLFMVVDENASPYLQQNVTTYTKAVIQPPDDEESKEPPGHAMKMADSPTTPMTDTLNLEDEEFKESNLMHSINGYVYGNMPMITLKKDTNVRWYLIGMGNEVDIHTAHWHGVTALDHGARTDVVELTPAIFKTVDMVPDVAGVWLFHCHVADHMMAGMMARFEVTP